MIWSLLAQGLKGLEYGSWTIERAGIEEEYVSSNGRDDNPWQQTMRALNACKDWFVANQMVFLDVPEPYPSNDVRLWPELLLIRTDSEDRHALPLAPQSRFGTFVFRAEDWGRNIERWRPNVGINMTKSEVSALIRTLNLSEWHQPTAPDIAEPDSNPPGEIEWVKGLVSWAQDVDRRLRSIEQLLQGRQDR